MGCLDWKAVVITMLRLTAAFQIENKDKFLSPGRFSFHSFSFLLSPSFTNDNISFHNCPDHCTRTTCYTFAYLWWMLQQCICFRSVGNVSGLDHQVQSSHYFSIITPGMRRKVVKMERPDDDKGEIDRPTLTFYRQLGDFCSIRLCITWRIKAPDWVGGFRT